MHLILPNQKEKVVEEAYLRNLETKSEVSPLRVKWQYDPPSRNSENQDFARKKYAIGRAEEYKEKEKGELG